MKLYPTTRRFVPFLLATLVLMAALLVIDAPLETDPAPRGIVSFELAGTALEAERILYSWDLAGVRQRVVWSLVLDMPFLVAYSVTLAMACFWAASVFERRQWRGVALTRAVGWGQLVAGGLDLVENLALLSLVSGRTSDAMARLAAWSATIKFGLVEIGLLVIAVGMVARFGLLISTSGDRATTTGSATS